MPQPNQPQADPNEPIFQKYEGLKDFANLDARVTTYEPLIGKVGVAQFRHQIKEVRLDVKEPVTFYTLVGKLIEKNLREPTVFDLGKKASEGQTVAPEDEYKVFIKAGKKVFNTRYSPKEDED